MLAKTLKSLSIPKEKNIVFTSPEPQRWPSLLDENKLIAENVPNRLKSRRELLGTARNYTLRAMDIIGPSNVPENIIATGHQAIWHHCGIWAKNLATCKFAKTIGGINLHLALDHDICDTAMVLPKQNTDGSWYFERIEIEPEQKAIPLEFRRPPQGDHIKSFVDTVAKARPGQFCNDIWSECVVLKANNISYFNSIADLITYFQSVLNAAFGLNIMYLPVSKLSESDAFVNYVISIMLDTSNFATIYNNVVTKQINELRINPRDTVQRLKLDNTAGLTELPFWLYLPNGKRASLYVTSKKTDKVRIGTVSTALGKLDSACLSSKADQLKNILQQTSYRLRPKAVSLTLFVRLYIADWFVHGIGGNQYEPVTDYIIENYYKMKPLKFGLATSTMTLPIRNNVAFPNCNISQFKRELHNIRHNPEKYLDESILKEEPAASLLRAKREKIMQAKDHSLPTNLRKSAWCSLVRINQSLSEYTKNTAKTVEKKIVEFEKNKISQETCDCREYFFGLFPENRLRKLAKSLIFTEPE